MQKLSMQSTPSRTANVTMNLPASASDVTTGHTHYVDECWHRMPDYRPP